MWPCFIFQKKKKTTFSFRPLHRNTIVHIHYYTVSSKTNWSDVWTFLAVNNDFIFHSAHFSSVSSSNMLWVRRFVELDWIFFCPCRPAAHGAVQYNGAHSIDTTGSLIKCFYAFAMLVFPIVSGCTCALATQCSIEKYFINWHSIACVRAHTCHFQTLCALMLKRKMGNGCSFALAADRKHEMSINRFYCVRVNRGGQIGSNTHSHTHITPHHAHTRKSFIWFFFFSIVVFGVRHL